MKNKFVIFTLSLLATTSLVQAHGGGAFAGGMITGYALGGGFSQPSQTIIVDSDNNDSDDLQDTVDELNRRIQKLERQRDEQERRNEKLQNENDDLNNKIRNK